MTVWEPGVSTCFRRCIPFYARSGALKLKAGPDGGKPAFHRLAELYFTTQAEMEQSLGSAEGQATVADLQNFATGGVTVLIGSVED